MLREFEGVNVARNTVTCPTTTPIRTPIAALHGGNPYAERIESGTRISNVKEAHQCLESGEHDDYRQDIDYVLSTLLDPASTTNLKCLSVISLAKKCVSAEFRQFFRTQNFFPRTIKALIDSAGCPSVAISVSAVIYLMARDKVCMSLDATSLRLLSQLLKMEKPKNNDEFNKYAKMAWDVLQEWLDKTRVGLEHEVQFDFTEATLSPSLLVLESLVYICTRNNNDQSLKNEMLNLGVLQWIVSKGYIITVDKTVLRLLHEKIGEPETLQCLVTLERCFWILETVSNRASVFCTE
ncbi:Wings apart-like -like protein [Toxocara canis]|uniref:Wings apart-like-like protein n=1 Tax=Toxocara canis TaxID=6265 RepID=A0A0B2W5Z3_TOXCA|nr:Wings apart-like -like protein [Toxocara canis]